MLVEISNQLSVKPNATVKMMILFGKFNEVNFFLDNIILESEVDLRVAKFQSESRRAVLSIYSQKQ